MNYCSDFYPGFALSANATSLRQIVLNMAETILTVDSTTWAQYEAQEILNLPLSQIDLYVYHQLVLLINNLCPPFLQVGIDPYSERNPIIDVDEERLRTAVAQGIVAPLDNHDQVLSYLNDMQERSFRFLLWMDLDRPEYALFSLETDETRLIWTELHWEYRQHLNL